MLPKTSLWSGITQGLRTAGTILGSLAAGGLVGWLISYQLPAIGPWPLLVGLILGLILGAWQALREVKKN